MKTVNRYRAAPGLAVPLLLLAMYSSAAAATAAAREAILKLDPANTQISYTLKGWPHMTHGIFKLEQGMIRVDPATGKADGSISIAAASGDSGSRMRDNEMKDSILEVQRYPEITFSPQRVEGSPSAQGEFPIKLRGILTLHGAGHEITLRMMVHPSGDEFRASGHFVVPYVAWGLKNPSILIFRCADTVDVDVSTLGHVSWVAAAQGANARASAR
jgi:polyisoprenoid-binding protein YceI